MSTVMLGDRARDTVTGYEGTIVKVMQELGCRDQVCVERAAPGDGKPEQEWFAIARVEAAS